MIVINSDFQLSEFYGLTNKDVSAVYWAQNTPGFPGIKIGQVEQVGRWVFPDQNWAAGDFQVGRRRGARQEGIPHQPEAQPATLSSSCQPCVAPHIGSPQPDLKSKKRAKLSKRVQEEDIVKFCNLAESINCGGGYQMTKAVLSN